MSEEKRPRREREEREPTYNFDPSLYNLVLENSVLACIFVDNNIVDIVFTRIENEDFYSESNRIIFESMLRLHEKRLAIDHVTLREDLSARAALARIGGDEYLFSITDTLPNALNIESYVEQLAGLGQKRRFALAAARVASAGGSPEHADDLVAWGMREMAQAAKTKDQGKWGDDALGLLRQSVVKMHAGIEMRQRTGSAITGYTSGLKIVDDKTGGMMGGDVIVVAGRPGMGKTSFALNMAVSNVMPVYGPPLFVPIFSLEMPRDQLMARIICAEARINSERWRKSELRVDEMKKLAEIAERFNVMNGGDGPSFYIHDKPGITLSEIKVVVRREKAKWADLGFSLGPIFIDYLQLMEDDDRRANREQQVSNISRGIKGFAKEENVPLVALSQLNRSVETRNVKDRRPQLSDLRESGAIEQDADQVWFLYRDEVYNRDSPDKGVAEVIIGKHRAGARSTARCAFFDSYGLFQDFGEDDNRGRPRDGVYDDNDDNAGF